MMPLRYQISNWDQLPQCKSNNSRDLSISVTDFIENDILQGLRISINHPKFGVVFSYVVNARGSILSDYGTDAQNPSDFKFTLTPSQILSELERWGFYIRYNVPEKLSGTMLSLLMAVNNLGYDKIRILQTYTYDDQGHQIFNWQVVAFNIDGNNDWINPGYAPSEKEYMESIGKGTAFNVSALSKDKHLDWSWLYNCVMSIDDILKDNAEAYGQQQGTTQ